MLPFEQQNQNKNLTIFLIRNQSYRFATRDQNNKSRKKKNLHVYPIIWMSRQLQHLIMIILHLHSHFLSFFLSHTHFLSLSRTNTLSLYLTHTHSLSHTHTHTLHTHTLSLSHTHSLSLTHTLSFSFSPPLTSHTQITAYVYTEGRLDDNVQPVVSNKQTQGGGGVPYIIMRRNLKNVCFFLGSPINDVTVVVERG